MLHQFLEKATIPPPIMLQKKLLAEQSAEADCSFRVGTTSEYLAKLPHLLEEPSHLPAELQKLVSKPELASDLFFWSIMGGRNVVFSRSLCYINSLKKRQFRPP